MRSLLSFFVVLLCAGCASTADVTAYKAALVPGGNWQVRCNDDHAKAERTCFAGTFGEATTTLKYFQIAYVNGHGPILTVPNDYPGKSATVRVDSGPVLSEPTAIVSALKSGSTAYVVFYTWPYGEQRMTVSTAGFAAAYAALLAKL